MKNTILVTLIIILTGSCIFKMENEKTKTGISFLTVSSAFTDGDGDQIINLSYSSNSTSISGSIENVHSANVYISDNMNNVIQFNETEGGKYVSKIPGIPGRIYTLNIILSNGKKYHSSPETMPLCPEIQNIYYKFEQDNVLNDYSKYGYNVYVDFKDDNEPGDFYQWNWIHYTTTETCATCPSRYVFKNITKTCEKITVSPNNDNVNKDGVNYFACSGNCWDILRGDVFNLLSDFYYNGEIVKGVKVHRAIFKRIPTQYYLQIQQRKITKTAYLYLKSLESQIKSNGTLFDVPAQTQFNFNLFSDNNPNEKILGIFNVYSFKKKIVVIPINQVVNGMNPAPNDPFKIPYEEGEFPSIIEADCINSENRSNTAPEGWLY